jgi:parallel beta-helix repeat protein
VFKRRVLLLLLPLLFLSASSFLFRGNSKVVSATIIVPDDYAKIQDAIDNASAGDTISVRNGTYSENLNVYKVLSLVGENPETTIIDGNQSGIWTVQISSDHVTMTGFTVEGALHIRNFGIWIVGRYGNVSGNTIIDCQWGVTVLGSNNIISGNNLTQNTQLGIMVRSSSSNVISENNMTEGTQLENSLNNTVTGNTLTNAITLSGGSSNNTVAGNDCSDVVLDSSSGNVISGNNVTGGVQLRNSLNNTITGNDLTNMIQLSDGSSSNTVTGNDCDGLTLDSSSGNNITANTFVAHGLYAYNSYANIVNNNTLNGRPVVYLEGVTDQTVQNADVAEVVLVSCSQMHLKNLGSTNTTAITTLELLDTNNTEVTGTRNAKIELVTPSSNNNVTGNGIRFLYVNSSSHNIIVGNDITSLGIQLLYSSYNNIIGNNITNNGIIASYSSNNNISENNIADNGVGIDIGDPQYFGVGGSDNIMAGNNITNNDDGIKLGSSNSTIIIGNNIASNLRGITVGYPVQGGCSDTSILENNITDNTNYGVELIYSANTRIFHNNFVNNSLQAYTNKSPNSSWDNGYASAGNYWSDYAGVDLYSGPYQNMTGPDWIGDTPYVVDSSNRDNYPLMRPFSLETDEIKAAYRNLIIKLSELTTNLETLNSSYNQLVDVNGPLLSQIANLNTTYNQLLQNYMALQNSFNSLNASYQQHLQDYSNLQTNYTSLQNSYNQLQATINSLSSSINSLNTTLNDYKTSTQNNLTVYTDLVYAFIAVTAILAATTIYLATRKPKTKPKTENPPKANTEPETRPETKTETGPDTQEA